MFPANPAQTMTLPPAECLFENNRDSLRKSCNLKASAPSPSKLNFFSSDDKTIPFLLSPYNLLFATAQTSNYVASFRNGCSLSAIVSQMHHCRQNLANAASIQIGLKHVKRLSRSHFTLSSFTNEPSRCTICQLFRCSFPFSLSVRISIIQRRRY